MNVYYKEMLSKPEELKERIQRVASEDNQNLISMLNHLRKEAGENHPLTQAYEREYAIRSEASVQKEVERHNRCK